MLIQRADVRLAVVAGLGNGLAVLSGLPFGYYVPLAVLAMGTGSYGGALGLGRQRILGSALGSLLVVVGSRGLAGVPMPLALALTLAALRLIGGALGLQVGYKVGGVIVVMGWLVHGAQLDQWIGLRLGWTSFGVILTLLSLRLFWPSHALPQALADRAALLGDIGSLFRDLADQREGLPSPAMERTRALQIRHTQLRRQVPSLAEEFGSLALRHPAARLIEALNQAGSGLLQAGGMLARRPPAGADSPALQGLHKAELAALHRVADRLDLWRASLAAGRPALPQPPAGPLDLPGSWRDLALNLHDPELATASPLALERWAGRLMLCRRAHQVVREAERQWLELQAPGREAHHRSRR